MNNRKTTDTIRKSFELIEKHNNDLLLFFQACENGNDELVEKLLLKVNPASINNKAIKLAAKNGNLKILYLFLNDHRIDKHQFLRILAEYGHLQLIEILLKDSNIHIVSFLYDAIEVASKNSHADVVRRLLRDYRIPSVNIAYSRFFIGLCAGGHLLAIKGFLVHNSRFDPSYDKNRAVEVAVENGHENVVEILLKDKRITDGLVNTFNGYCASGNIESVKRIIQDPSFNPSSGFSIAFRNACKNGHLSIVELLLKDKRVDPYCLISYVGGKPDISGHFGVAVLLLEDGRYKANSFLEAAASKGHLAIVEMLLEDSTNENEDTKLYEAAAANGHVKVLEKLLLVYGNSDEEDDENDAGMYRMKNYILGLCRGGYSAAIEFLLEDSLISRDESDMEQFIRQASFFRHMDIVEILLKYSGDNRASLLYFAFHQAVVDNLLPLVEKLLQDPVVDPSAYCNQPVRSAASFGNCAILKLLLKDPRVEPSDEDEADYEGEAICVAITNRHLEPVMILLKDPRVNPGAEDNQFFWEVVENCQPNLTILRCLLRDERLIKTNLTDDPLEVEPKRVRLLKKILLKSRLRMKWMYSRDYFSFSKIPRYLINLINSFVEPYTDDEINKFGLFIENLYRKRDNKEVVSTTSTTSHSDTVTVKKKKTRKSSNF